MLSLAATAALMLAGPTETEVTLETAPAPLHGTLLQPEGPTLATAILIPGSGPTDRNGNSPYGITNSTLKQFAEGLAAKGIATVRIDKRGIAASAPAMVAEVDLRFDTMIDDAKAWAAQTVRRQNIPCVWMIGHSEGALVAQAAAKDNAEVCGVVMLAGVGRRASEGLREQLGPQLPEPIKTQAFEALSELEQGRMAPDAPAALAALLRPSIQPYLVSWFKYDPAELAAGYPRPLFIGQGTTDLQVTVTDAQALATAQPNATLKIWEGVNHLLLEAPAERSANLAAYMNPDAKIAPQITEDVAAFITAPR